MKKRKKIPHFNNEAEELEFWSTHDSTDFVDWSKATSPLFPNLKPTSRLISIRFPVSVLERLQTLANRRDIPYQTLIKLFVNRELSKEFHRPKAA
jgi:predicted DNA binding CopG/RHH family protein